jgi:hypothetical protein
MIDRYEDAPFPLGCGRILCVIDDFSRECLAMVVDNSLSGMRVAIDDTHACVSTVDIIAECDSIRR